MSQQKNFALESSDMVRKWHFPALIFALFSLIIVQINPAAAASPAEQAIASWFQSLKDAGAKTASYDALRFDEATDTITVVNPQIDWNIKFPGDNSPSFDIVFSTAQIVITGFRQEADGFSARQYSMPEDAQVKIKFFDTNGSIVTLANTIKGIKAEGVFYPRITPLPEDPQRPISRYLHYYDLYLKTVIEKSTIDQILMTQTLNGEVGLRAEYNGISVRGLQNGQFEEVRMATYKQTIDFPKEAGDGSFEKMETTYGETIQRGVDLRPIVDALNGQGTGPGSEYRTVVAEASVSDMNILVGPINISMENYTIAGVKVRPGKRSLLAMLDRLALGEEIDDKESLATSLDFARGFAVDEVSVSNLKGSGPENISASMARFVIRNLSNQGLEKFAIEGVDINGSDGEKVSFDESTIGDVIFPSVEDILAAVEQGPPSDPFAAAALGPKIGKIQITNLLFDDKKKPAISLGLFRMLQSGFIGAIATDIKIDTEDFRLPVAYIEDPMAQTMLQSLGYEVLKIAAKFALKWDEASQDLTLEVADISLDNGVNVKLKAGVTGLPRSVIENPQNIVEAMSTLAFKNVNFLVKDAVLVTGLIDYFAKVQKTPPESLRTMIVDTIELQAGPLTGTPFIEDLKTALSSFLKNPKRLSVDLNPKAPVPFTQVLGTVSAAPDQLPALLGANVSAN